MVGKLSSLGVESIRHPKIIADIRAWLSDRLGADIARLVEEVPPVELPNQAPDPAPIEEALAEYTGGIVPEKMRLAIRDAYQSAGITQAQVATMLGLSRPHLANALAGRYSLSSARVVKLRAFLARPRR